MLQVPLLATPSKALAWASIHAEEAEPEVSVEVGDDGLPLGVFERHNLSPRKRLVALVTHQQHLDSWRLTELCSFRQQQRQQELAEEEKGQKEEAAKAQAGSSGATGAAQDARGMKGDSSVAGIVGNASAQAVQLQRKLSADCSIAEGAASPLAAADSAVQGLFSGRGLSQKPCKRPSMHSTATALKPQLLHNNGPLHVPVLAASAATEAKPALMLQGGTPGTHASEGNPRHLEQNLWGVFGGLGRNGRCREVSSIAALQTPRPNL